MLQVIESVPFLLVAYRIAALSVGALFVFFGYRLFKIGYFEKGGELQAAWGKKRFALKQTAPGIFFALFGAIVIGIGMWKPLTISRTEIPEDVAAVINKAMSCPEISATDRMALLRWLQHPSGGTAK